LEIGYVRFCEADIFPFPTNRFKSDHNKIILFTGLFKRRLASYRNCVPASGGIVEEIIVIYFKMLSQYFPGEVEDNYENTSG
jgi:hypothetical protein